MPETPSPLAQLTEMRDKATLDHEGQQPFHLKASFQVYSLDGKPAQAGTLELWYAGQHRVKRVMTIAGETVTNNTPLSRELYIARMAALYYLRPMGDVNLGETTILPATMRSFGAVTFKCFPIASNRAIATNRESTMNAAPARTYCSDPTGAILRVYGTQSVETFFTRMGSFGGAPVPLDVVTNLAHTRALTVHLEQLSSMSQTEADQHVEPTPLVTGDVSKGKPGMGGARAGTKIGGEPPHYPDDAKYNHVSGTVIIAAIISRDGTVQTPIVIASPDNSLSRAALQAVRTWKYDPYLLNGEPTDVDTTLTVNFNLNSR